MDVSFEKLENVGIFTFEGAITTKQENDLQILLMKAIHGIDRAVLNFRKVTRIDFVCRELLRKAYCTSVRLKNPIIITEVPRNYLSEIFNCNAADNTDYSFIESSSEEYQDYKESSA
jgi:anti-anti-sigma regulatory factor